MGPADNMSYKNMYHFTDAGQWIAPSDLPSINIDPKINDTIKKNPYKSNVEIEGDEIVLEPDMSALFKARGKKHSNGGMDVNLKPDSFIFSDDPNLSFNEKDHKLFELKEGGNFNKTTNTPADVLKRNIDTKHYNTMVANIQDPKKDDFAKKSSAMMLQKYLQTLGNVAYIQERKKNFPNGVPAFAKDTAPVYDTELKDNIESQKQFAKYGGTINSPYMQKGGSQIDPCSPGTPCHKILHPHLYHTTRITNNKPAPQINTPYPAPTNNPWATNSQGHICPDGSPGFFNGATGQWDCNQTQVLGNYSLTSASVTQTTTNSLTGAAETGKDINWQFNPYQLESQAYNALKYASAKRYMPYRSHLNSSYVQPNLTNPEQTIGDMQSQVNSQIGALRSVNPIMRNAEAANDYGQFLNRIPGVRSQYDTQNTGTINQFREYNNNNNIRNTEQNAQNDQQYYQQSITGQANYDNMKNYLGDQVMNNRMGDIQQNQTLALNEAMLGPNNPYKYNFRTMGYDRQPVDIKGIQSNNKGDDIEVYAQTLIDKYHVDPSKAFDIAVKASGVKTMGNLSRGMKKGGRFNPYL